jgi:YVTN family beta-propeller protein
MKKIVILFFSCCIGLTACAGGPGASDSARPHGYHLYVTNERSGDLTIIDGMTLEATATAPLGKRPRGIHASPDGKTIYVALSGSPIGGPGVDESKLPPPDKSADGIGVFDVRSSKLLKLIPGGSDPEEFAINKDGALLYISNEDAGQLSIIDIAAGKSVASVPVGEEPEGVTISPDGKVVFVTSENDGTISVIDTSARTLLKTFHVGARPRHVTFLPDSSKAYVTRENDGIVTLVDAMKYEPIQDINIGTPGQIKPMSVILSPDATRAYVSTGRGKKVFIINTATNMVTGSIEVGDRPWGMALSPDAKTLFTANGPAPSNDVSVVDLSTQTVTKKIKVGNSPWGVLMLPD